MQDLSDKPGEVRNESADVEATDSPERHPVGIISVVPPTVVPSLVAPGGLPRTHPMAIPKGDSETITPLPAMHAPGSLASLDRLDHHHHRHDPDSGPLQSHPAAAGGSSSRGYIRTGSPSREATGGDVLDLALALQISDTLATSPVTPPTFHFGSTVTAFTAGDGSGVVSPTSPQTTLPLRPTSTAAGPARTIANRRAQKQAQADKMLFSDLYKSPLSKLKSSHPHPVPAASPDYDADLVSRDKSRNKEAVRRFLEDKIRTDWEFRWPLPTVTAEGITTAASTEETSAKSAGDGVVVENPATDGAAPASEVSFSFSTLPNAASNPSEVIEKDSGDEADSGSDAESTYSIVSEDATHFRPRAEWTSDLSDTDIMGGATSPKNILSPFRFDSPDAVGAAVLSKVQAKRTKRRRALRDEVAWNDGLACFVARRDAWTGAKTVRVRPRHTVTPPLSPTSARRLSFWKTHSRTEHTHHSSSPTNDHPLINSVSAPAAAAGNNPLSPTTTNTSSDHTSEPECHPSTSYPIETLLPLAPPLIPLTNSMRTSIVPGIYASIYDKVVTNLMQPSCPINLSDMIRSCVVGWKRDGEWPPRPAPPEAAVVTRRKQQTTATARRMSFAGMLGGRKGTSDEKEEEKGLRKSLQKVFSGLGNGTHHGGAVAA